MAQCFQRPLKEKYCKPSSAAGSGKIQPGSVEAGDDVLPEHGGTKVVISYLAMMTFLENMWPGVAAEVVSHEAVHPPEARNGSSRK